MIHSAITYPWSPGLEWPRDRQRPRRVRQVGPAKPGMSELEGSNSPGGTSDGRTSRTGERTAAAGATEDRSAKHHGEDAALVGAAMGGQERSRSQLVERLACVPAMLRVIARRRGMTLAPSELEDLEQETLLEIWRKLDRFDGRAALETWVWGFCFNQIRRVGQRRANRPYLHGDAELEEVEQDNTASELELDDIDRVHDAVEEIGPPANEVVRLRYREELSFEEIGKRLAIPSNTAKTHYYRALARLRQRLACLASPSDQ